MIRISCQHECRRKFGKDRKGRQRYQCNVCRQIFLSEEKRPLADLRISLDDAAKVLQLLLEGVSIRAAHRITGIDKNTICRLILVAGENCQKFLKDSVKNVAAEVIELDEIWDFVGRKNKTKERLGYLDDSGDSWTWLAIDSKSKLVLSHAVGGRNESTYDRFMKQLSAATTGNCQITSDGLPLYRSVPFYFGTRCSFSQLTKIYAASPAETRYSPAKIIGTEKIVRFGNPDRKLISTSYAERLNLSLRMHVRRYTRLTTAHSKSFRHHSAMTALFCAWYNFCRTNSACGKKTTPAMAAGLTDCVWGIKELLQGAA